MQGDFTDAATILSEAEKALKGWGVKYTKDADGTLRVPGDIDIAWKGLTALPDLSDVLVEGNFYCQNNALTSLKGAPRRVKLDFNCANNAITSLEFAPESPGGFGCDHNLLETLEGGPKTVGPFGYFCSGNRLKSLAGAPIEVEGGFFCHNNPLESLEGAPRKFKFLYINNDEYKSWNEVPEERRTSPETKLRLQEEQRIAAEQALEAAVITATVLQAPMKARAPLRFKSGFQAV